MEARKEVPTVTRAEWKEFDRRCYFGLLADWLLLAACAVVIVAVVASSQVFLHHVPTPAYRPAPVGVWCRTPDGGLVHRPAC